MFHKPNCNCGSVNDILTLIVSTTSSPHTPHPLQVSLIRSFQASLSQHLLCHKIEPSIRSLISFKSLKLGQRLWQTYDWLNLWAHITFCFCFSIWGPDHICKNRAIPPVKTKVDYDLRGQRTKVSTDEFRSRNQLKTKKLLLKWNKNTKRQNNFLFHLWRTASQTLFGIFSLFTLTLPFVKLIFHKSVTFLWGNSVLYLMCTAAC